MKENMIYLLDHGYVELLNIASAIHNDDLDRAPAACARVSFDNLNAERTKDEDLKLARYLIDHQHNTPIEMVEIWLHMKLPIFVARQFVRHRTATINEVSARYVQLPEEFYVPEVVRGKAKTNKQGSEDNLTVDVQREFKAALASVCETSYEYYVNAIDRGVAPELARLFLHVNHYTNWVWKQDLHNMMHFLKLRLDNHAQWEAQQYARAIVKLLTDKLPETMKYFSV